MKIALAGQRSFGAAVLQAVLEQDHEVAHVFAPLDDRLDWEARRCDIPVSERLTADQLPEGLDLIVCAHAHVIVSERALSRTLLGGIGYHPSLLPRHRGRDAVRWTVHMHDPIAGGSVYWLSQRVDGGPLAATDYCHVDPAWSASDLWGERLFPMGIRLLTGVLRDLDDGKLVRVAQEEACATWEPSWDRPPADRPDLPQITNGHDAVARRFRVVTDRDAA